MKTFQEKQFYMIYIVPHAELKGSPFLFQTLPRSPESLPTVWSVELEFSLKPQKLAGQHF